MDTPNSTSNLIDLNFQPIVTNDFIVNNTGNTFLLFSSFASTAYSIGRDLIINNSSLVDFDYEGTITINIGRNLIINDNALLSMAYIANTTVNIAGDLLISGGSFDIDADEFGGSPNGVGILNLEGNFLCNGGQFSRSGNGLANLNFNGSGSIDFTNESSIDINYSFGSNSIYNIVAGALSGPGDLTVNENVILGISSPEGISSGISVGNIKVAGTRTYGSNLTLIYNGFQNQNLGNGLPANDFNLAIDNENGAFMSSNIIISGPPTTLNRTLSLTSGALDISNYTLTLNGLVNTTSGGLSGGPTSSLIIGGTGPFGILGFVGTTELQNFTLDRTSSGTVTLGGPLTVVGDFTQNNGELILNGNSLTISEDFTQTNDGTITADAQSVLIINGAGALPTPSISLSGDLQKLTMDRASANLSTGASNFAVDSLNLFSGTLTNAGTTTINAGGRVERRAAGQLTNQLTAAGTYNLVYNNVAPITTGPEFPTNATALNNLIKRNTGIVTLASNSTINGNLELINGELDAGSQSIDLKGDFISDANSILENATFTFSGFTNVTGATAPTFGNITVSGTLNPMTNFNIKGNLVNDGTLNSSAGIATFGGNTTISGSQPVTFNEINIVNTLIASSTQPVTVTGDFNNSGSFDANGGTVVFGGITNINGISPNFNTINITGSLNSPNILSIAGNLINDGIFNHNNGIVDMTGTGTRSISGSNPLTLNILNVSGGTLNNNNSSVSIFNGITIGASTIFDVDGSGAGNLVLESRSATEAAYVGIIPSNSSITGNITVERYFNQGRFYRYLGSPVANTTIADWQEEFPITGLFTNPSTGTFDGVPLNSSNPSLFYYDAIISEYVAYPTSGTAASNPIENGRGYAPFIRNNTSNIIGAVTGVLKQQDATLPVDFSGNPSESWNLVANPYAAPIDWDAAGWTKVNVFDELHVPIAETGGFATYVAGVGSNGGSQYIASGQAFWVRTSAASPSLATVEGIKSVDQSPIFYRDNNPIETFRVKLESPIFSDEIVFALRDSASFAFDPNVDAIRRLNGNNQYTFSSLSEDDLKLKINSIPKINNTDCSITLPLIMESVTRTGSFTLSFEGSENLLNYYSADLFDNFSGNMVSLHNDDSYTFTVSSDSLSKSPNRFSLILNNREVTLLGTLDNLSTCEGKDANYTLSGLDPAITYVVYKNEKEITVFGGESNMTFLIPDSLLGYEPSDFTIYGKIGGCDSSVVGTFKANLEKSVNLETAVMGSEVCSDDMGTVSFASESDILYKFAIDGLLVAEVIGNGDQIVTVIPQEYLKIGSNEVTISAYTESCGSVDLNSSALIEISDLDKPEILANSNILQSSLDGDFYQWFFNGELLNGENNDSIVVNKDGEYEVIVRKGGCEKISDTYVFISEITSNEKSLKEQLKLYPNPILDYMNIESNFANLDLKILTLDGKLVKTYSTDKARAKVDMADLKSGVYYLTVNIPGEGFVTYTIVKR